MIRLCGHPLERRSHHIDGGEGGARAPDGDAVLRRHPRALRLPQAVLADRVRNLRAFGVDVPRMLRAMPAALGYTAGSLRTKLIYLRPPPNRTRPPESRHTSMSTELCLKKPSFYFANPSFF